MKFSLSDINPKFLAANAEALRAQGFDVSDGSLKLPVETATKRKTLAESRLEMAAERAKHSKASDAELVESYAKTRSIWKTAEEFGMCGQSVHERLTRLKIIESTKITDEERALIRDAYSQNFLRGDHVLKQLSEITGRTRQLLCREAKKMGLTNPARSRTPEMIKAQGEAVSASFKKNGHPRGFLGGKHTPESLEKISKAATGRVIPPEQTLRTMKTRLEKYGTVAPPRNGTTWKAGWREIGGQKIYARSRWEANYARYLQMLKEGGSIKEWEHEPETFWFEGIKRGTCSYLPDFRVTENDGRIKYHEVKGWMDPRSKTKLKRMKKYHPTVELVLIQKPWFKANASKLKGILRGWEDEKGPRLEVEVFSS